METRSGTLTGLGAIKLFYRVWEPKRSTGSLILVHGVAEHTGRYHHVADFFTQMGLTVYALDHRGHGKSEGSRTHVDRFDDYLHDLDLMVAVATEAGRPMMLGHSMGGLVAFRYALAHPEKLRAMILSSPWFGTRAKVSKVELALAPLLSRLTPMLRMPPKLAARDVCRDPAIVAAYAADPLIEVKFTTRWAVEGLAAIAGTHKQAANFGLPVLFLQAEADRLVDPAATRAVFDLIRSASKTYKMYPDMYHEILNDPDKERVLGDIRQWLTEQALVTTQ